eukprot:TRINITY_DN10566_c0_g1_i1.p1 TRINITY_DN10566_c0_g1~~TRINITY_DN10566_c0_g1_i1.p1  ORF type:complete len:103 (-),score=28.34 TRINITY_DN10566_c0_g1_i1:36-344(-)
MALDVVAVFKVKNNEDVETVVETINQLIAITTEQDHGCIKYTLRQKIDDPTYLTVLEIWESEQALNDHSQTAHVVAAIPKIIPYLEEGYPIITTLVEPKPAL